MVGCCSTVAECFMCMICVHYCFLYSRVYRILVSLMDHKMRHTRAGMEKLVCLVAKGDTDAIKRRRSELLFISIC